MYLDKRVSSAGIATQAGEVWEVCEQLADSQGPQPCQPASMPSAQVEVE